MITAATITPATTIIITRAMFIRRRRRTCRSCGCRRWSGLAFAAGLIALLWAAAFWAMR